MKKKVCMIVPSFTARGGISAVVGGYRQSRLACDYDIRYIETYCDGGKFRKTCKAVHSYFTFIKVLLVWHPDIIHIHSSFGASFYRKLPFIIMASLAHKPIINNIHGSYIGEFYNFAPSIKKAIVRKAYEKCKFIIALSEIWKKELSKIVPTVQILVLENYGILSEDAVQERFTRENHYQVLFLGFISKLKGCYDIPTVVKNVVNMVPTAQFVLAGSGDIEQIRRGISPELLSCVQFPGWVDGDVKISLLRQSDVFILPSYSEGMPMSILDAMGYGMPIVSTMVGGIPEIVREGQNGYLFEPGDTDGMAKVLVNILQNDTLRKCLGQASADIVKTEYSLDRHIEKLEEIYCAVLSGSQSE